MRANGIVLTLVSLLFLSAPLPGQAVETGSVTLSVATSFGAPLPGGRVHIDGPQVHEAIVIKGKTTVALPYGVYRFTTDSTGYYWSSERIVDVIVPRAFVLIALARKESFAVFGEGSQTPYTVHGSVMFSPSHHGKLFAQLRGLYLPIESESEIDGNGHFELATNFQGSYSVEILDGESIAAVKTVRLDEMKARPVRLAFKLP